MSYGQNRTQYLEAEVLSRPREWLIPLMYEHLLTSLRRAVLQIEAGDIEGKAASLEKAAGLVMELLGSLDVEQGGDLAARLAALYGYFAGEILAVGRSMDTRKLARLIEMVAEMHQAWVAAAESVAPRGRATAVTQRIAQA